MATQVQATVREAPPLTIIDLQGEVTTFAEKPVNNAYRQASELGAKHILLNFKDVEYINSAGIAAIIGVLTEARKVDQVLMITGLSTHYHKIFQIMGLSQYAPLVDSEEAALLVVAS
jgi:anti-anti-sigma factor